MADNKEQNKDAQSGQPVQLDKEHAKPRPGSQPGQPEGNQAGGQELGAEPEGGQGKQSQR